MTTADNLKGADGPRGSSSVGVCGVPDMHASHVVLRKWWAAAPWQEKGRQAQVGGREADI
jgi:hypothetical protein